MTRACSGRATRRSADLAETGREALGVRPDGVRVTALGVQVRGAHDAPALRPLEVHNAAHDVGLPADRRVEGERVAALLVRELAGACVDPLRHAVALHVEPELLRA